MDSKTTEKLREILFKYGVSICDKPKKLKALLNDFCPDDKGENFVLLNVVSEGIINDLLKIKDKSNYKLKSNHLKQKLIRNCGINEELSEWAINSWAYALRIIEEKNRYNNKNMIKEDSEKVELESNIKNNVDSVNTLNANTLYEKGNKLYNKKNYSKALKHFEKAAEKGHSAAQSKLAIMYIEGSGVKQDYNKALKLNKKAAKAGEIDAQTNLGLMYMEGLGVRQDYLESANWYKKAADQGDAHAQTSLAYMYHEGLGLQKNYQKALDLYKKAAYQGNSIAQEHLGVMYHNGIGVDKDPQRAERWYKQAINQGNEHARENLESLKKQGCFITTATCNSLGKKDDCYELSKFRWFRDRWLKQEEGGQQLIKKYYNISPKIVRTINMKSNSDKIYAEIWNDYLQKCLSQIEKKSYHNARLIYEKMVNDLMESYMS